MDNQNQQIPNHLIDHDYILLPARRPNDVVEEINQHRLDDHNYALPAIHQDVVENIPAVPVRDDIHHLVVPVEDAPVGLIETYTMLPGIRRNSTIYVDNLGFKYYKKYVLANTITLICERQKNPSRPMCHGSASVSRNVMENQILVRNPHNHEPFEIDLDIPFLRHDIGKRELDPTVTTTCARTLYNSEIVRHSEAAMKYMFI